MRKITAAQEKARFKPGRQVRKRGPNKITGLLREAILVAAENVGALDRKGNKGGLVGYLEFLARKHPKAYASLMGRVLPLQIHAKVVDDRPMTREELEERLRERGIPVEVLSLPPPSAVVEAEFEDVTEDGDMTDDVVKSSGTTH